MRRAALGGALAAVAAALLCLAPATWDSAPGAASRASAADCAWKRESRRVVKHVRRHGKRRRVVRTVPRWRCVPVLASPLPTAAAAVPQVLPPPPSEGTAPEPDPSIPRLGVKAAEFSYTLSRPEVAAGEVIVELNNAGEDPHNLNLQRIDDGDAPELSIDPVGPKQQRSERFQLPAGSYRLWCSLDNHAEEGMTATLVVGG